MVNYHGTYFFCCWQVDGPYIVKGAYFLISGERELIGRSLPFAMLYSFLLVTLIVGDMRSLQS